MNRQRLSNFLVISALLLLSSTSSALDLKAGKWGFTAIAQVPMAQQPVEDYTEQCIAGSYDPLAEMMDSEVATQCDITIHEDSSTTLNADMVCNIPNMGSMIGKMNFRVNNETASGGMEMVMDLGGQTMNMTTIMEGKYLGACD